MDKAIAPAEAWQSGLRAAHAGDLALAKSWLERALRLAPDDPRIALDLANLRLAEGTADGLALAMEGFEALAARYDVAAAWQGLIVARRRANDPGGAAAAAAAYLARHCAPEELWEMLGQVAAGAGRSGWCGFAASGQFLAEAAGRRVVARLDGIVLPLPKRLEALPAGRQLALAANRAALLGSPLDLAALRRVEGIVASAADGGLSGWACRPAALDAMPELAVLDADGGRAELQFGETLAPDEDAPFLRRHGFAVAAAALAGLRPPFRIVGPDGADLAGSPVDPAAEAAVAPVAPGSGAAPVRLRPERRALAVVVPIYRDLDVTKACLASVYAAAPAATEIIVVDDATPEPALAAWLDGEAAAGRITLLRQPRNGGFPAAANVGCRAAAGRDVLLLNSDTLVPPGAIETLIDAVYAAAANGSATPLSNEATILSYPRAAGGNPMPALERTVALNALAARANGAATVEIPTAIGFCMLMRHDCIAATGLFRAELFAQGYGEENDWCLRARQLGYRHVAATGALVAHHGGVSFRAASRALNSRNWALLNRIYPDYHWSVQRFLAADRLAPARRRLDLARFAAGRIEAGAVLLISHNHGGGVARQVAEEMAAIRAGGQRPILLFPGAPANPAGTHFPWDAELTDDAPGDYPNLRFVLRAMLPGLIDLLREEGVRRVVLHHGLGHHPAVRGIAAALAVPQDIVIHDYASFCPRVNLLTRPERQAALRYCGEPSVAGCIACVDLNGDETFEGLSVPRLLSRSAAEFAAAARITAPSADAARRIARHFPGVQPEVTPWEDDDAPFSLSPPRRGGRRKIAVIGGIGASKGFDLLIECAGDAARRGLPLDFVVAGGSAEDAGLLSAGIFVTGAYAEGEATGLVRALGADLAFFPSIWPETWCFTLGEAWRAGLYAVAFDLGAQAARIKATGRGAVLPLGLPAGRINDSLLAWQPDLLHSRAANKTMT